MWTFIGVVVAAIAIFIFGVLFGRKNKNKVEGTVDTAKVVGSKIDKVVDSIKTTDAVK